MEPVRKYGILLVGLLTMAFGVAFSVKADLGTSPISSLPYVCSLLVPYTVGQCTIMMHCAFIALQVLLLRRDFSPVQLLQLPVAFVFGYMIDFAMWCLDAVGCASYAVSWLWCIVGILLVGIGVSLEVVADVVVLAGEGLVLAVSRVSGWKFGNTKIGFDVSLVLAAGLLSLSFLHGLYGVREGTLAAAICVGAVAKTVNRKIFRLNS